MSTAVQFLTLVAIWALGVASGWTINNARWHRRMGRGYERLAVMARRSHIPSADDVAAAFSRETAP